MFDLGQDDARPTDPFVVRGHVVEAGDGLEKLERLLLFFFLFHLLEVLEDGLCDFVVILTQVSFDQRLLFLKQLKRLHCQLPFQNAH